MTIEVLIESVAPGGNLTRLQSSRKPTTRVTTSVVAYWSVFVGMDVS